MTGEQESQVRELEAPGWTRQFTTEVERANEYVELYESLGNEVRLEPVTPELLVAEECAACILAARDRYRVIYTRPKGHECKPHKLGKVGCYGQIVAVAVDGKAEQPVRVPDELREAVARFEEELGGNR